jgi:hypothetical protein
LVGAIQPGLRERPGAQEEAGVPGNTEVWVRSLRACARPRGRG